MAKNPLQSKQPRNPLNERWKPYIRYDKKEDRWISKAIRVDGDREEKVDTIIEKKQLKILMDREQLDIISRIVAYMYHDKKDEYKEIASDMQKEHIYKDLRAIDLWLNSQYKRLESKNEQSEQKKREHF